MCTIETEIEKYISEIESNLVCCGRLNKSLAKEIEGSVYDYAESRDIKDISEVYNHFGTPEEMARAYLSQVDPKKIRKAVNVRKVVIIGVVVALMMLAVFFVSLFIDAHITFDSSYNQEIVEDVIINDSYITE